VAFELGPGDIAPGEPAEKVAAALGRFRLEDAATIEDFDRGYRLLDAEFGPHNELERREVLERWFRSGSLSPPDATIRAFYHLLTVFDRDGRVAAVRDGFSAVDPAARRVVELMSHSLVLPEWRRSGVGALLRAAPAAYARQRAPAGAELSIVAEMEPLDPTVPATLVRLLAYRRSGFRVLPPTVVAYAQPDFRDVDALGVEPIPIPFLLVVRQVGEEQRESIRPARAIAIVDHIAAIHRPSVRPDQLDRIREVATRQIDPSGPDLPLWPLPESVDDLERLAPLLRGQVLPLFPPEWHGRPALDPERELHLLRGESDA
jgi:GNAT superfamily N-acetyltransferase